MTRFRILFFLQCLTLIIPLNIYVIGTWLGWGIQWALFRYQEIFARISIIPVTSEFGYIFSGTITGRSAFSLLAGGFSTCLLVAALCFLLLSYEYESEKGVKTAGILTIIAGILSILSLELQYGIFLNGPAGFALPVGIPLILVIGWMMYSGFYCRILPDEDCHQVEDGREFPKNRVLKNPIRSLVIKYQLVFFFLFIFFIYSIITGSRSSGDTFPATVLPYSIVMHHTITGDPFQALFINDPGVSYSFLTIGGHYYSLFPIVTPVLLLPLYAIQSALFSFLSIPVTQNNIYFTAHFASGLIAALSCLVLYITLKKLVSNRIALISTLLFAFATATWSISSQALWQHGMVELLLILMLYLVIRNEEFQSVFNLIGLGILAGLFIFNRPPDAILLIPVLGYVIFSCRHKIRLFLAGGLIGGLPFLLYNYVIFGNVFGGYVNNLSLFHLDWQFWFNYLALLISPNKGLLVYSPVLVLAIIGYFKIDTVKKPAVALLLKFFGPVILLDILIYSFFNDWMGGYCYGPRFLTGLLPILAIYLAIFLEFFTKSQFSCRWKQGMFAFISLLAFISIIIQIIGVFYFPFLTDIHMDPERAWDMNDSPIVRSYADGSEQMTSLSFVLLPPFPQMVLFSTERNNPAAVLSNGSYSRNYLNSTWEI